MMAWTSDIISLFHELKFSINSYPIVSCFDPEKLAYWKTDWSAEGIVWILMQLADDEEYQNATAHLKILENYYLTSLNMAPD